MTVSVIIPSFNYGHFLKETLEDLLLQTHSDWECIVIDNRSTDDTKNIVEEFIKRDPRFKYLFDEKKGPSTSRNMGIMAAKGEFIQFLDADDLIQHNKFKSALQLFGKNKEADIVYSDMRYFADGNKGELFYYMTMDKNADRKWMTYVRGGRKEILPALLKENIMVISSPLIKRSALMEVGLYIETLVFNEDWELWLRFALKNKTFFFDNTPDTMALIRVHKTSYSRDGYKMYYSGLKVCMQLLPQLSKEENDPAFVNKIKYHEMILTKMIYEGCSDKKLTIERLTELSKISSSFDKMLKNAQKYSGLVLKAIFYVNFKLKYSSYKPNA